MRVTGCNNRLVELLTELNNTLIYRAKLVVATNLTVNNKEVVV